MTRRPGYVQAQVPNHGTRTRDAAACAGALRAGARREGRGKKA